MSAMQSPAPSAATTALLRGLEVKLAGAFTRDTPERPVRPEIEAVSLARDVVNHAAVRRQLPLFVLDDTSLTSGSSIVLGDRSGELLAVLALKYIPPATRGAALECKLDSARALAKQRAAAFADSVLAGRPGEQSRLAVGCVTNLGGLEWLTPPPPVLARLAPLLGSMSSAPSSMPSGPGGTHNGLCSMPSGPCSTPSGGSSSSNAQANLAASTHIGNSFSRAARWVLRTAAAAVGMTVLTRTHAACSSAAMP